MASLRPLEWLEAIHLFAGIGHVLHIDMPAWLDVYVLPIALIVLLGVFVAKIYQKVLRACAAGFRAIARLFNALYWTSKFMSLAPRMVARWVRRVWKRL